MIANTTSSSNSLPGMLTVAGNEVRTPRYVVTVEKDRVVIRDPATGQSIEAFGDPHLHTSQGDRMQFQRDNVTLDLPDGTKITLVPTRAQNGVSYVGAVEVMCGNDVTIIRGIHGEQPPQVGPVTHNAQVLDGVYDDGTVLHTRGGNLADLVDANGREFVGGDFTQRFGEYMLDGLGGTSTTRLGGSSGGGIYGKMLDSIAVLYQKLYEKMGELDGVEPQSADMTRIMTEIQMLQMHIQQMMQTLTNVMKAQHDTIMAVAHNI